LRGAECNNGHYVVVAKVTEGPEVSKRIKGKERCNLKKLNDVEVEEQYQVKISNRLAAVENLDDKVDISRASQSIIQTGLQRKKTWMIMWTSVGFRKVLVI
jgi:predicted RecB family endonuclease